MTRLPNLVEADAEGRDAVNIVLGAMLGGYLGLTISREGVPNDDYMALGGLLTFIVFFVLSTNAARNRFHTGNVGYAAAWLAASAFSAATAFSFAEPIPVDRGVLTTILAIWSGFAIWEMLTAIPALITGGDRKG